MIEWLDGAASILIAIAFVAFAMKISWAAWNDFTPGGNLWIAIATPILKIAAFGITFLFVVNMLPFMANYGFAQAYNSVDNSSLRAGAVEVLGSTASLFSEQPYMAEISVPDAPPLTEVFPNISASRAPAARPPVQRAAPTAIAPPPAAAATPEATWRNVTSYKDPNTGEVKSLVPTAVPVDPAPTSTPAGGPLAADADAADAEIGTTVYTIKRGDTMHKIALVHYGDGDKWRAICNANANIISDCSDLRSGQIILLP